MGNLSACDVVVVGGGVAGVVAAIAARERGAHVVLLEKSDRGERGGNGRLTGGNVRFAFDGAQELHDFVPHMTRADWEAHDIAPYPARRFADDLTAASNGRADPALIPWFALESQGAARWLLARGVAWQVSGTFAHDAGGRSRSADGIVVAVEGGGAALVEQLYAYAERVGVEIRYATAAERILDSAARVDGVLLDGSHPLWAERGVVIAAGGFEASAALRERFLGAEWRDVTVRAVRWNTGEILMDALRVGAAPHGAWNECHACPIDPRSPPFGNERTGERTIRLGFQFGITVNDEGRRFMDEGWDVAAQTYATVGRRILAQPRRRAFQIFDQRSLPFIDARYADAEPITASSIAELARRAGIDPLNLTATAEAYNAAVDESVPFDPSRLDGRRASVNPPKSNWAQRLDRPPYVAYATVAGITFTYGGVRIDTHARVLGDDGIAIPRLFATGELTGGFFFDPYPAACGILRNVVTAVAAGTSATRPLKARD